MYEQFNWLNKLFKTKIGKRIFLNYHCMMAGILDYILSSKKSCKKLLAVLVDPDKNPTASFIEQAEAEGADLFFVGGSYLASGNTTDTVSLIKKHSALPVVLFPGSPSQITPNADGILLLSLISGRNPELLIGQHVLAAPALKESKLEIIPTGYILIDGGKTTSVQYISNTTPIPADKNEIAVSTAMAGEMLGLKLIYMEAGSGALNPVTQTLIQHVRSQIQIPLIIGGGIRTPEVAANACKAGADVVVVGNLFETHPGLLNQIAKAVHDTALQLSKTKMDT